MEELLNLLDECLYNAKNGSAQDVEFYWGKAMGAVTLYSRLFWYKYPELEHLAILLWEEDYAPAFKGLMK